MGQTIYSAASELRRPGRFLADAAADLRAALPIATALICSFIRSRRLARMISASRPERVLRR